MNEYEWKTCERCGHKVQVRVTATVLDFVKSGGPLHLMLGKLPVGWVNLTLTNATSVDVFAQVWQEWNGDSRRVVIDILIPPGGEQLRLAAPGPVRALIPARVGHPE